MRKVHEEHPKLYHYTNLGGLEGIIKSQTLWATHYKGLNDFSEVQYMRQILERVTFRIVNDIMRKTARSSLKYKRYLEKHGGLAMTSKREAKGIVDIFYDITFGKGGRRGAPFAEPYVFSFCSHSDQTEYVQKNGLLSQWRGYGADGGVAIVFNTKKLWAILQRELEHFDYSAFNLASVIYNEADLPDDERFEKLKEALQNFIKKAAESSGASIPAGDVFRPFFDNVTRFKHPGFEEENEIRIAVSPVPQHVQDAADEERYEGERVRLKPTFTHPNKLGLGVSRVTLNDVPKAKRLPIEKIIIGPQRDQDLAAQRVRKMVGRKRITVTKSATPYIQM